jgi:hypothetical protein
MLIGALQCLLGVMLGVGLLGSAFVSGEGPGISVGGLFLVALDVVLLVPGVFALFSGLEQWDPPDNRWHGFRWPMLGLVGSAITLFSWVVTATLIWGT